VSGSQVRVIGPAAWVGALHVVPPSSEETKPTNSWHVVSVHAELGKEW
jgi:hypothetical protein